jgi:hypothetical protein
MNELPPFAEQRVYPLTDYRRQAASTGRVMLLEGFRVSPWRLILRGAPEAPWTDRRSRAQLRVKLRVTDLVAKDYTSELEQMDRELESEPQSLGRCLALDPFLFECLQVGICVFVLGSCLKEIKHRFCFVNIVDQRVAPIVIANVRSENLFPYADRNQFVDVQIFAYPKVRLAGPF